MSKILLIAKRDFVATVFTKAFLIGLVMPPVLIAMGLLVTVWLGSKLFAGRDSPVHGKVALIDPTGKVAPEWNDTLTLVERPADTDIEQEKHWLRIADDASPHLALALIHGDAVERRAGETTFGSYDLYVPPDQDHRADAAIQESLREAIVSARIKARGLDRAEIDDLVTVARAEAVTVGAGASEADEDDESTGEGAAKSLLPIAFMGLLLMAVMGSGQGLLTTTIEEKSSRVIEVLLSAVSPMQLMAGKLLGHMGISLVGMSLYLGLGIFSLSSLSLSGVLPPMMIVYLLIFFLLAFFMFGSLMMAMGAAVNDLREAQSFMTPMTLILMLPWILWLPVSRDPNSRLSLVVSFLPPLNPFGMLLRITSSSPPPAWQIWLSVAIGVAAVVGALWAAAKIFRIGLLTFGKPPNVATLVRWIREA